MANVKNLTVKIIIPDQEPRYIQNAAFYKGKVVQIIKVGVGKPVTRGGRNSYGEGETWEEYSSYRDEYRVFFNGKALAADGKKDAAEAASNKYKKGWPTAALDEWLPYMFQMGDNPHGYRVVDPEEEKMKQVIAAKTVTLRDGFNGFLINERLPSDVWAHLKPYAKYYKKSEIEEWYEDMDDFHLVDSAYEKSGWNYSKEIIEVLVKLGWKVMYYQFPVSSFADVHAANEQINERERQAAELAKEKRETAARLEKQMRSLGWEYMDKADTPAVEALPDFHVKLMKWEGPGIYGVGYWAKRDENYLYKVSQNGHDGDDWSLNNSREGIIYRTPLTDQVRTLLAEIEAFENQPK